MSAEACRTAHRERGAAVVLAIVLSLVVSALAAAIWTASRTEALLAASFGRAAEALHAAEGAAELAIRDLAAIPNWSDVLAGTTVSSFTEGAAIGSRRTPGGDTLVLCCGPSSMTDAVQQRARDGRSWGGDTPVWRLFAWGPAAGWLPPGEIRTPIYVAVWVADDVVDGDGDAGADNNGIVEIHAQALGVSGARRIVEATLQRQALGSGAAGPGVRVLSWREVRW